MSKKQYGSFGTIQGLLEEIPESEVKAKEEEVTGFVKESLTTEGLNPDDFYYESIIRQSYYDGNDTDEKHPRVWDEPIFNNSVPLVTVAITATER
ncbi:hypothetical protein [Paenibacillus sp. DMB20]|uniref:hypothetical protein n=1 Tax=Paenibacillus sp. DMB20 TaxID=1642570 RepID=UPI0006280F69|nr:hypothetical protein [Paenibacillus sp. DMB20]KKO51135.1 hypothetical protein XI25_29555 [Paenibacillus sp. DMB20]